MEPRSETKKGRQLPRTDFILQNENAALRNRVKYLNETLETAYAETRTMKITITELQLSYKSSIDDYTEKIKQLQKENAELKNNVKRNYLNIKTYSN